MEVIDLTASDDEEMAERWLIDRLASDMSTLSFTRSPIKEENVPAPPPPLISAELASTIDSLESWMHDRRSGVDDYELSYSSHINIVEQNSSRTQPFTIPVPADDEVERLEREVEENRRRRKEKLSADTSLVTNFLEAMVVESQKHLSVSRRYTLTEEEKAKLDEIFTGPLDEIILKAFSVDLLRKDILTAKGRNWLNDEVINMWMNLLQVRDTERVNALKIKPSHFFK